MDAYLHFKIAIFYSSNCNLGGFSTHNLSLLLISTLCLNLIIPNIMCESIPAVSIPILPGETSGHTPGI